MTAVDLRIHNVYLLASLDPLCSGRYYVGYTTDPLRRLRQHNGDLTQGAKRTSARGRPWALVAVISGFGEDRCALRFEWSWQWPGKAKALREAARALHSARIGRSSLPYAIAILHRLLVVEPFSEVRLKLFVLRKDLFFPLSAAVSNVVPPPREIAATMFEQPALLGAGAGASLAKFAKATQHLRIAWEQKKQQQQQQQQHSNNSPLLNATQTNPNSSQRLHDQAKALLTVEFGEDAEQKLAAAVGGGGAVAVNRSQQQQQQQQQTASQQSSLNLSQKAPGVRSRVGAAAERSNASTTGGASAILSDVDSSDTDTGEATRQLEELGCVGCSLCGRSAPTIFALMRCPGNFCESDGRRDDGGFDNGVGGDDDGDDDVRIVASASSAQSYSDVPRCTMQCHVGCLAMWFEYCASSSQSQQAQQQQQQQGNDVTALLDMGSSQNLLLGDDDDDASNVNNNPLSAPPPALKIPPAGVAPCPVCGTALQWPLLAASLKDRLRRHRARCELKRRIALEMRRVGLRVKAKPAAASRSNSNAPPLAPAAGGGTSERKDKKSNNNNNNDDDNLFVDADDEADANANQVGIRRRRKRTKNDATQQFVQQPPPPPPPAPPPPASQQQQERVANMFKLPTQAELDDLFNS